MKYPLLTITKLDYKVLETSLHGMDELEILIEEIVKYTSAIWCPELSIYLRGYMTRMYTLWIDTTVSLRINNILYWCYAIDRA